METNRARVFGLLFLLAADAQAADFAAGNVNDLERVMNQLSHKMGLAPSRDKKHLPPQIADARFVKRVPKLARICLVCHRPHCPYMPGHYYVNHDGVSTYVGAEHSEQPYGSPPVAVDESALAGAGAR